MDTPKSEGIDRLGHAAAGSQPSYGKMLEIKWVGNTAFWDFAWRTRQASWDFMEMDVALGIFCLWIVQCKLSNQGMWTALQNEDGYDFQVFRSQYQGF
jgi:hypothetical protein